jgi:hypothetical protein
MISVTAMTAPPVSLGASAYPPLLAVQYWKLKRCKAETMFFSYGGNLLRIDEGKAYTGAFSVDLF